MDHGFKIVVQGENKLPCLSVKKETNGQLVMEILDPEQVKNKIEENKTEKALLQMLLLYGQLGSLKAVQKECLLHEEIDLIVEKIINCQSETRQIRTKNVEFT